MTKAALILVLTMTIQMGFGQLSLTNNQSKKKSLQRKYKCEHVGVQKVKHIQGRSKVIKPVAIIKPSNNNLLTAKVTEITPELIKPQEIVEKENNTETIIPELTDTIKKIDTEISLLPQPVYFRYDSYRLDIIDLTQIALAVKCVKAGRSVEVVGHTDNWGSERYNQTLSLKRANIIRDMMIELGCNPAMIVAKGEGEKFPAGTNEHETGRQNNRRVEFVFTDAVVTQN